MMSSSSRKHTRITLATLFYSHYYSWPLPQSFFYAVDAGMSIGFCTDVAETDAASRAFTIVHILLGASCVGGALVLMVGSVLEGVACRSSAVYGLMLEGDSMKKAFFAKGRGGNNGDDGPSSTLRSSMDWAFRRREAAGAEGVATAPSLTYGKFREALRDNGLETMTEEEFRRVCAFYDPDGEGRIGYDRFAARFEGVRRMVPQSRFARPDGGPSPPPLLRALARAWEATSSLVTNETRRIYLIFVLWVGMGITWGVVDQGWDPITAAHFAVSALATGGLTAPPVDEDTGILPAGAAWFCGLYCLFGIPLMALTLGIFARVLVEGHVVEEELAAISRPLTAAECRFASKSLCSTDAAVHLSDYIVLQLMRQGKLSMESFEFMKRQYQVLDRRPFWLRSVGPD